MKLILLIGILLILWDPWIKNLCIQNWAKVKLRREERLKVKALAAVRPEPEDWKIEVDALCDRAQDRPSSYYGYESRALAIKTLSTKYAHVRKAKEQVAWSIRNDPFNASLAMTALNQMTQVKP